nr:TnpA transposase [uncultured bacterium]
MPRRLPWRACHKPTFSRRRKPHARRSILSAAERESLLALPDTKDELIRHYTFSESDLSIIRQRRGPANRLGFAVQLCYPRQNGLAVALRELGRIERTLFILDWLQSVELRRRVHAGLNKGEARNALARAVFFNRLGEIRDRSFEQQRYRASGLNLVTAAIVLWNTVYLERAANALRGHGQAVDDGLLQYLSPLGWEHINLTGDYLWRSSAKIGAGKFRPLRPLQPA